MKSVTKKDVLKEAEVGFELAKELIKVCKNDKQQLSSKLSLVNQVFTKINPEWKGMLIDGTETPANFARMSERDMATKDTLEKMKEIQKKANEANRTDGEAIEHSKSTAESIIQCFNCKQKKVTFYLQQTRSADEPMTQFCTCLNCGKRWKI